MINPASAHRTDDWVNACVPRSFATIGHRYANGRELAPSSHVETDLRAADAGRRPDRAVQNDGYSAR